MERLPLTDAAAAVNGIQEVSGSIPLISTKKHSISFEIECFSILFSLFCAGHFHLGQQMDNRPSQFLLSYCGKEEVMASIKEEGTRGKRLSYKFRVCLGRDENGRQISKAMRWNPPEDMTPAKARKEAQRVAAVWEAEQKEAFERQKTQQKGRKTDYTFGQFVDEVWVPLCVRDGSHRPSTVAMYTNILKVMRPHFEELLLSGISGIQITQYLTWLRNEYRTQYGKPLAEKSIKHHYNILSFIFGYAEKQDLIEKNPMKKVDAPKVRRRAVDALSEEDARRFFEELNALDFDFRCILQLLITTGLRRGECIGLQWQDVDFDSCIIRVERAVSYTPESGIVVAPPKTATSIRTVPLEESTTNLLKALYRQRQKQYPNCFMATAFLFCKEGTPFEPRDPSAVTRRMKRFVTRAGLPDVSPHDLRHSCASLLYANGVSLKEFKSGWDAAIFPPHPTSIPI